MKKKGGNLIIDEFDKTVFNIGEDFDVNNRGVIIEMKMGGTYIDVSAILTKNGKNLKTT